MNRCGLGLLLAVALTALVAVCPGFAQDTNAPHANETKEQRDARMKWWREAKFGMFIHWGVYSVPAGKYGDKDRYGEWIMKQAKIPVAEYKEYSKRFNPVKFNAAEWVRIAKNAGQKYIVITSKHHDGFAMFQSKASDYNIYEATPFKRNPLKELAVECEKEGIKLGFYYSQAQDWVNPGGAAQGGHWDPAQDGDFAAYLDRVAIPQVKELFTNFGKFPSVLWFDLPVSMTPELATKFFPILNTRPDLIVNDRLGGGAKGDFVTAEQGVPDQGIPGHDWETCMTMNGNWGYCEADKKFMSGADVIRKLAEIASKGGNYLLNVGPTAEGVFPEPCVEALKIAGEWMKVNGDSVYGTTAGPFKHLSWGIGASRKGQRLYLHVTQWPTNGVLRVPLANKVGNAELLAQPGKKLETRNDGALTIINVPVAAPDAVDSVVAIDFEGEPILPPSPALSWKVKASSSMNNAPPENAIDGNVRTVWRSEPGTNGWFEVDMGRPTAINYMKLIEMDPVTPRGKRGIKYQLLYRDGDTWRTAAAWNGKGQMHTTAGYGDTRTFPTVTAQVFRLDIFFAAGQCFVSELKLNGPE